MLKIIEKTGVDLDVIEMLILDCMKSCANSKDCACTLQENKMWYHISTRSIIQGMPSLNIKSKSAISRRINKLVAANLLIRHPKLTNFYAFNTDEIYF